MRGPRRPRGRRWVAAVTAVVAVAVAAAVFVLRPPQGDAASRMPAPVVVLPGRPSPPVPQWIYPVINLTLTNVFQDEAPRRITLIRYPRKIAVVFTFTRPTRGFIHPPGGRPPRFRVWRTSFDRQTHRGTGTGRACATTLECL